MTTENQEQLPDETLVTGETIDQVQEETQEVDQGSPETTPSEASEEEAIEEKVELTQAQQKKFNEAYFKTKQAEREADALRKQLEDLKSNKPNKVETPTNKTLEDFDFDDQAYQDYVIDQKVEAKLVQHSAKAQEQQTATAQQAQQQTVMDSFNTRANEYIESNPDYSEAMGNAQHIQYSPALGEAVLHEGPQLDHYLLTNPQVVDKLNGIQGYQLSKELNTLMGNLSKSKEVKRSNAPKPVDVVTGGGRISKPASEKDDMASYYAKEMERLSKK